MSTRYAQEFTTEMGPEYEASILNKIGDEESAALGNVNTKRREGGLDSLASAGAETGALEAGFSREREGAIGQFNLDVANKKYSERMTDQQEQFQDIEDQKNRDFQHQLAIMGYEHDDAVRHGAKIEGQQGAIVGGLFGLGGSGIKAAGAAAAG